MQISEVLDKAADLIDERGLAHGRFRDNAGRICVVEAISQITGVPHFTHRDPPQVERDAYRLYQWVNQRIYLHAGYIPTSRWSDSHDKEYVVAKLREFAEKERGRERADED